MRTSRPENAPIRQRLATAALVALAAVTVLLVVLAVEHTSTGAALPSQSIGPSTQPRKTGGASSPASPAASSADGPALLALAGDRTLVTASPGACGGAAPVVRFSTDGGATFHRARTSEPVSSVLAVSADSADELGFVGTDRACDPQRFAGGTAAPKWDRMASTDTSWHLLPGDKDSVHTPGGPVPTPCRPVSLSPAAPVRVLCDGGRIIGSDDNGATWVALGRAPTARLVAFSGPGVGYAIARRPSCSNALLTTDDGGATWTTGHCFRGGRARALAVAAGSDVVALVDDQVWASHDGGDTWTAAS